MARAPQNRVFCVCAGFARVATAVFRAHTVPAWVRVGFASYLNSGFWEDHWVCEYRSGETWLLLDAQLDETAVRDFGVDFAPWDVPRDRFLDASTAWRQLRAGELDPSTIGLSAIGLAGAWFVAQSVLRDAAALNNVEMLPWKPGQWAERSAPGRTSRPILPQSSTRWPRSSAAHRTPIWHDGFTASTNGSGSRRPF